MKSNKAYTPLDWFGAITGIIGAIIVASNLGITWFGYVAFLMSSVTYSYFGWKVKRNGILTMNLFFIIINVIGLIRWF